MIPGLLHNLYSRLIDRSVDAAPQYRGGADIFASRHAVGVRPVTATDRTSIRLLWTALLLLSLAPLQAVAANNGDQIINRAQLNTTQHPPIVSTVTVTIRMRTQSTLEFMKYAPQSQGAVGVSVTTTYYSNANGSYVAMNQPITVGTGAAINLSAPVPLIKAAVFHTGEPIFIRLTDLDQNLDRNSTETVLVTLTDPNTGDSETLRLTESGIDTGIFFGYIQTASGTTGGANNGILSVSESSSIQAHYFDVVDGTDSSADAALVDPFGIVFDTVTGKPVDGATVELLNADGTAASVLGDSGLPTNSYPNSVISGSIARDTEGNTYSFTPGGYKFPFVNPGDYILKITPPTTYSSPSTVTTLAIQALPGAPFTILEPGSRGEKFAVPAGPAIRVDIPIDPKIGSLWVQKSAGKSIVSAGEHLSYDITIENSDTVGTVFSPVISDKLPPGFRYRKDSAKINGLTAPDPAISADGSTLTFALANIPPATSMTIRYVVAVGAGARTGTAANTALATAASAVKSNLATATVQVQEPFMQSRNIIMGRVFVGACSENSDDNKKGLEGIGIYLEDGTFVNSDKFGMFHFEGIRSGSHVVQLDLDSIPEGYRILPCEQNSRFAGRAYSQFVDLQGGTMWRTDFYLGKVELSSPLATTTSESTVSIGKGAENLPTSPLEKIKPEPEAYAVYKGEITLEMISTQSDDVIDYRLPLHAHTVPLKNLQLSVELPEAAYYLPGSSTFNGATLPDPEISGSTLLFPLENANEKWLRELQFRAKVNKKSKTGDLETKAVLKFDSETTRDVHTPGVTNILSISREEKILPLPLFVFRPHFPTFGAELSNVDRLELDELVRKLSGKLVERIDVSGHTDNVRIAPRSRGIHADNNALSLARAKSIGHYLATALHLPPAALYLNGSADKEPIASNKTPEGRALNRRVEVKISAVEKIETTHLKIIKERSGVEKTETRGAPVRLNGDQQSLLTPLQPKEETLMTQTAENSAGALASADEQSSSDSIKQNTKKTLTALQEKSIATVSAKKGEHAVLISALNEGIVHYRIRLKNIQEPLQGATVTLVVPKNLLYMTGTTQLMDNAGSDPVVDGSTLKFNFSKLTDLKKFDLRLQALLDNDTQSSETASNVTVVITDAEGKPLRTFTAVVELSDDMEEIHRPDLPAGKEQSANQGIPEKDESEEYREQILKASPPAAKSATGTNDHNSGLQVGDEPGILSPADGSIIVNQINAVRIVLSSSLTPVLVLDGKEISRERVGFTLKDSKSEKSLYTYIGLDFGNPGEHLLQLKGVDGFGVIRFEKSAKITRTDEITSIRLVSTEGNIADGKSPVRIKVQLFDKNDRAVPANAELTLRSGDLRPLSAAGNTVRDVGATTVSVLDQGWINFQPVTSSGLYRAQLSYNKAVLDIETYVKPKMRNWIVVGLAEGTVGYNTVSGHMENLKSSGQEENFYDKERLALYAKGTVKGEWLLTMAYDSAKRSTGVNGNGLFQTIDPNSYYTIYGDSTSQLYDSASQRKLYLKIERDQFYALFGDYDTGLTVTELSRYSRRMNGIKSEFRDINFDVTVFGSETGQSFAKDEIRGDGTSGLYHLSKRGIVLNSEKIIIETRDRFHSEVVTGSTQMGRFIDYNIDYDSGAIFFKSPIASKDEQLNPVYIVVDYEIANAGKDALTYGGHAATKMLNGKLQVGGTYVHEGQISGESNLYGADATAILAPGTKARAEFATTNNDVGIKTRGNAYLAEITHTDKQFDGKLYFREQEDGFGLGQQKGSETGTRKYGAEAGYKLSDKVTLNSQGYRQYNLASGAVRDFMEALASYNEKQYSLRTGVRYASDSLPDGSNATSIQATAGGSWKTADQKFTLRADHDQALFSKNINTDFPTRTILGVDYQATKTTMLFAQEELTYGVAANTNTTRVGIKSTPWSGGTLNSSIVNDMRENNERTFANVGLTQKWQLNPRWAVDGGLDHNQTIRKKSGYTLNANVPPASGGDDFTAVSLGANYTEKKLSWSNRVEYRNSDTDDKWGLVSGLINEQGLNWGWTTRLQLLHTQSVGGNSNTNADLRFGLAFRPPVTKWIILDRLDLLATDEKTATSSTQGKRIINNLNANYKPDKSTQLSIQYGAKYVLEKIDDKDYSGYTDLIGFEGRYDITREWDIGLRTSVLHTWAGEQYKYSLGPSIGFNVMENAWLSLGYNFTGFNDRDFSAANYTAQGPFVQFRFKFDQNSVKDGLKALNQ